MIIVIDIGNTNMEFGIFKGSILVNNFRIKTKEDITSDEIGLLTTQFLFVNNILIENIDEIVIASVVPQVNYSVSSFILKYFKKNPIFIGEDIEIDIKNLYDNPKGVGIDRLVNSWYGFLKYKSPVIVVDFGTATTFDVVSKNGEYLGGVIYPGVKISYEALFKNASKIPRVEISAPKFILGKNTVDSIQSGIVNGYVGCVKNIVKSIQQEFEYKFKVVATGGLSKLIGDYYNFDDIDPHLTIQSMIHIYTKYKNNRD